MKWLAIRNRNGMFTCQSRNDREKKLSECMNLNKPIGSIVEREFNNRNEAENYCKIINEVNDLIKTINNNS